jgi:hypothetical protein
MRPKTARAVFEQDFSILRSLEYPIEQVPPVFMDDSDFSVYRTPTALKIMLSVNAPTASEVCARPGPGVMRRMVRLFLIVISMRSSTMPRRSRSKRWQRSMCKPEIRRSRLMSSTTAASRQEYLTLAKKIRERYFSHMGIDPDATTDNPAALAIGNQHMNQNSGVDRLVHGKYTR